jgi:hypothetical protein
MPFSYTVSSANTWTYVTITVPAGTNALPNPGNGQGVFVRFGLGASGNRSGGTAGTWTSAGNFAQPAGTVSVVGTNGATFYITGVQLEKGSTATSFDYRPYGTELALCQRYYWRLSANSNGTNIAIGSSANSTVTSFAVKTPVTMRATPTMSFSTLIVDDGGTVSSVSSLISILSFVNADVIAFNTSGGSTLTTGRAGRLIANTAGTSFLDFSIEL